MDTLGEAGVLSVNTEDAAVEDITVNGWEASLITTDVLQVVIPFPATTQILIVTFSTEDMLPDKEVFLRISEGISLYWWNIWFIKCQNYLGELLYEKFTKTFALLLAITLLSVITVSASTVSGVRSADIQPRYIGAHDAKEALIKAGKSQANKRR